MNMYYCRAAETVAGRGEGGGWTCCIGGWAEKE